MRCKKCGTIVPESEIYTDFYYCHFCNESMPTRGKIMNIKLTKNEYLLHKIGMNNATDTNKYFREFYDIFSNQPERLNKEDHNEKIIDMICDSPNHPTKGVESNRND